VSRHPSVVVVLEVDVVLLELVDVLVLDVVVVGGSVDDVLVMLEVDVVLLELVDVLVLDVVVVGGSVDDVVVVLEVDVVLLELVDVLVLDVVVVGGSVDDVVVVLEVDVVLLELVDVLVLDVVVVGSSQALVPSTQTTPRERNTSWSGPRPNQFHPYSQVPWPSVSMCGEDTDPALTDVGKDVQEAPPSTDVAVRAFNGLPTHAETHSPFRSVASDGWLSLPAPPLTLASSSVG
jgi:hypothetical protein